MKLGARSQKLVKSKQVGNGNETARPIITNGILKNINCTLSKNQTDVD
jgi:hypothetical protein